jgi:hypothetical protein
MNKNDELTRANRLVDIQTGIAQDDSKSAPRMTNQRFEIVDGAYAFEVMDSEKLDDEAGPFVASFRERAHAELFVKVLRQGEPSTRAAAARENRAGL